MLILHDRVGNDLSCGETVNYKDYLVWNYGFDEFVVTFKFVQEF